MKYKQKCQCCEHELVAYTHSINRPMVSALSQLVSFYLEHKKKANLQKDLQLTKNQYNNFQKLQYFHLVKRTLGGWLPTELGTAFIDGHTSVKVPVATLGKEILSDNHEAWETHSQRRQIKTVRDYMDIGYKQREDYQAEKSPQARINF